MVLLQLGQLTHPIGLFGHIQTNFPSIERKHPSVCQKIVHTNSCLTITYNVYIFFIQILKQLEAHVHTKNSRQKKKPTYIYPTGLHAHAQVGSLLLTDDPDGASRILWILAV
jgi:hypothetical protein